MLSKNKLYKIFYGRNYDNLYSGISGFFFIWAHKNLEKISSTPKNMVKILEIGPGRFPHYDFIENKKNIKKYFFFETNLHNIRFIKKKYLEKNKFNFIKSLNNIKKNTFDRIILSHVLEHVDNPEDFILKLKKILKKNGNLCITLPCDPGLAWDVGRLVNYLFFWRKKSILKKEYYYHMAIEHKNSIQNLLSILKYHFLKISEVYLPIRIPIISINLMCNIVINK